MFSKEPLKTKAWKGRLLLKSLSRLYQIRRNQWLSLDELRMIQLGKLKDMLTHAYNNVPYYQRLFDSVQLRPEDIRTLEDIKKIPVTRKADLKNLPVTELLSKDVNMGTLTRRYTSGSTGVPFNIYHSWEDKIFQALMNLRILIENGLGVTDKVAHIVARQMVGQRFFFQSLGLLRKYYIPVTCSVDEQLAILEKKLPDAIYGYSSSIKLLILKMKESGKMNIRPKMVFCTSELLELGDRELINSTLGISLCDIYGTVEIGDFAWECPAHEGYHIDINNFVVEFLKDGKDASPGEEGMVVCTGLHSFAMPFIRYEVGDICVPLEKKCSCGRGLPLIAMIMGRADDFVRMPDGQCVPHSVFVIPSIPGVAQYRIIQKKIDRLLVQVAPTSGFTKDSYNKVRDYVRWAARKVTGNNIINVEVEVVDSLPKDPSSNKIRRVISEINPNHV